MPELFLEILCEEIPARMQRRAAEDLKRLVTGGLVDAGLTYEGAYATATPRRLVLSVQGLPARSADRREERKGPRVGAPEKAVEGFLRAAGLGSLDEAEVVSDPKKGDFYVARTMVPGRPAVAVAAEVIGDAIRRFPWPVSMRWGPASEDPGSLRWIRPLTSLVATFGAENEDPEVVPVDVGIPVGTTTVGHRFHAPGEIHVRRLDDYAPALERAHVVVDHARRRDMILHDARDRAFALGLELVEDEGLLDEVAGLVEWPVVLVGRFDERSLELPDEVIRLTIRQNQKCFVTRDPATGRLANAFILTANLDAPDGGAAIIAGNERVIRARLADARFFWEQDLRVPLEEHAKKLAGVTFHEKLGSQAERVERIASLAREIAPAVGADPDMAERAARLAKADLATAMVGEFPELQGYIGRRYAEAAGEPEEIAAAIEEHYWPIGADDEVAHSPTSIVIALAEKIDRLVGMFSLELQPTGSRDPYGLRRAAFGVVRIVVENRHRLRLRDYLDMNWQLQISCWMRTQRLSKSEVIDRVTRRLLPLRNLEHAQDALDLYLDALLPVERGRTIDNTLASLADPHRLRGWSISRFELMLYLQARLVTLINAGDDHAEIVAAAARVDEANDQTRDARLEANDDFFDLWSRVKALSAFLATEDGATLMAGYRRATNILKAEEKKDGAPATPDFHRDALVEPEELALADAVATARNLVGEAVAREDYAAAMSAIAALRAPVDRFFDKVLVNADDPALRRNRLSLLAALRDVTRQVADFSAISS